MSASELVVWALLIVYGEKYTLLGHDSLHARSKSLGIRKGQMTCDPEVPVSSDLFGYW